MTAEKVAIVLQLQKAGDKRTFGDITLSMGFVDVYALKAYADSADGTPR